MTQQLVSSDRSQSDGFVDVRLLVERRARAKGLEARVEDFSQILPKIHSDRGQALSRLQLMVIKKEETPVELRDAVKTLREIVRESRRTWIQVRRDGGAGLPDTVHELLSLVCAVGAKTVVLDSVALPNERQNGGAKRKFLGFALLNEAPAPFTDFEYLPDDIRKIPGLCEFSRLMVIDEAAQRGVKGLAMDVLMEKLHEVAAGRQIFSIVNYDPPEFAHPWAYNAVERRGYERIITKQAIILPSIDPKGSKVDVVCHIWVYPPTTEAGQQHQNQQQRLSAETEMKLQASVVAAGTYLPPTRSLIYYAGPDPLPTLSALSCLYQHNTFISTGPKPGMPPIVFRGGALDLPGTKRVLPDEFHGIVLNAQLESFLQDSLVGNDLEVRQHLEKYLRQIAIEGRLIIQDRAPAAVVTENFNQLAQILMDSGFRILQGRVEESREFCLVAEKVPENHGVQICPAEIEAESRYFEHQAFKFANPETGKLEIWETIGRPGREDVYDLVVVCEHDGEPYVIAVDYPLPIATALPRELDSRFPVGYVTEPISEVVPPGESASQSAGRRARLLAQVAGISESEIIKEHKATEVFTSPRLVKERVTSEIVEIKPRLYLLSRELNFETELNANGSLRSISVWEFLRACQRGLGANPRLESKLYEYLINANKPLKSWFGTPVKLNLQEDPAIQSILAEKLLANLSSEARFTITSLPSPEGQFLRKVTQRFIEFGANRKVLARTTRSFAKTSADSKISSNTISFLPVCRIKDRSGEEKILVGLQSRHLPAVQLITGKSQHITIPSMLIRSEFASPEAAINYALSDLKKKFRVNPISSGRLGGSYPASPVATDELVHPYWVEVDSASLKDSPLHWVELKDLVEHCPLAKNSLLVTSAYRLYHALSANFK